MQAWGFELGRSYPRNVRHRISANPRNRNETCILSQVNKVTGFQRLQAGRNLELGRHFNAQAQRIQQRLDVAGGRLSETVINELRLVYNFNVRSFVRAIVQHHETERDPALFRSPVQRHTELLFSQLLFSYKVNPQTVLFIGYSDNHVGIDAIDLRQTGRTFFAKLGYAWIK
ncbi:MAG TPA: hypothetical protein VNA04_00235 [Thermoanaerobaculia bacterium]|nr:hypothetical protein [Thermoanaerobaculia bacterium]